MVLEGDTTDYAIEQNAIQGSLPDVSVCMIAKWTYREAQPSPEKCVFSYAIPELYDELLELSHFPSGFPWRVEVWSALC